MDTKGAERAQHTPGPWSSGGKGLIRRCIYRPATNGQPSKMIAKTYAFMGSPGVEDANAELISTAPELLAALRCVLDCSPSLPQDVREMAEFVVMRAKGGL